MKHTLFALFALLALVSCSSRSETKPERRPASVSASYSGLLIDQKFQLFDHIVLQFDTGNGVASSYLTGGTVKYGAPIVITLGWTYALQSPWMELALWIDPATGDLEGNWTLYDYGFTSFHWGSVNLRRG